MTRKPLKIGLSPRFLHTAPPEMGFRGKTLQYLEQSAAHWLMTAGALVFMIPSIAGGGLLRRGNLRIADYVAELDGLVLQGGADVSPLTYGETPLRRDWEGDRVRCTGQPVGVIRTREPLTNFELVARWRHLKPGGNSGIFVWAPQEALAGLEPGTLPRGGIEVQVLDTAFAEQYQQKTGKAGDFFTTHGDVFPVGTSEMEPFPPTSPDGSRGFPRQERVKDAGNWNHYYVRAINGEVRLWVNGEEVSGGRDCRPAEGYLCLESEGSPVEFKDVRIRELP